MGVDCGVVVIFMFTEEELANEEWRPVVGWEDLYEVSSLGRVKRLERTIPKPKGGTKTLPEKLVATNPDADGFVTVLLRAGDRRSVTKAHRLVMDAFSTNEKNFRFIAHLNGIGYDNRVENLAWVRNPRDAKTTTHSLDRDYDEKRKRLLSEHALPEEEWRDIDGYEGLYLVSNYGRVFSVPRPRAKAGILNPATAANGYQHVTLCKDGEMQIAGIHRLVAMAFLDNRYDKPVINHRDEDKTNNFAQNLEFCDYAYNANYGTGIERRSSARRSIVADRSGVIMNTIDESEMTGRGYSGRKPVLQYDTNGTLLRRWPSITEASKGTGVCTDSISVACHRKGGCRNDGISCGYRWDFEGVDYGKAS